MLFFILLIVSYQLNTLLAENSCYNEVSDTDSCESSTDHMFELTQSINLARQEHIQKICDRFYPNSSINNLQPQNLDHLLVNHKHKLLYCYVPKIACTTWKRIFMILSDKWNATDILAIPASLAHAAGTFPHLGELSASEQNYVLENYTKLIFVRHPFERLLSAYRNKLEIESPSATYFQQRVGKLIVKLLRSNPSNESLLLGNDVTFREFVVFLTMPSKRMDETLYSVNEHWETITKLCHPCAVKYNIIGKYETFLDDSILALHSINATHIQFPRDIRTAGTSAKLKKYLQPLSLELIRKLFNIYKRDFQLFNYDLEDILGFDLA